MFEKFNSILKPFSDSKLEELKDELTVKVHNNKLKHIASKYTK
jgi:hypothetical protein